MVQLFGAPRRYLQGPGILRAIGSELIRLGDNAVILIDPGLSESVGAIIRDSCHDAGVAVRLFPFGGECSVSEIDRLVERCAGSAPRIVAAAGGGKCLDSGKALAHRFGAHVVTIPTAASTDAPTSHNYVLYDSEHRLASVEKLPANPDLVLVDTAIIARAPIHLFIAGMGDAIVKPFEVERCMAAGGKTIFGAGSCETARILAHGCYQTILRDGDAALVAIRRGEPDAALERVVEATVLMSGLSFESGGLSIAHSMTRGLSAIPAYAHALHGRQVAYALLVQLLLEGDSVTLEELRAVYRRFGLPLRLADLSEAAVDHVPTTDELRLVAELSLAAPHASHFPRRIAVAEMVEAITALERLGGDAILPGGAVTEDRAQMGSSFADSGRRRQAGAASLHS